VRAISSSWDRRTSSCSESPPQANTVPSPEPTFVRPPIPWADEFANEALGRARNQPFVRPLIPWADEFANEALGRARNQPFVRPLIPWADEFANEALGTATRPHGWTDRRHGATMPQCDDRSSSSRWPRP